MNGEPHADELYLMLGRHGAAFDTWTSDRSVIIVETEGNRKKKKKKYYYHWR